MEWLITIALIALLFLGAPIFVVILGATIAGFYYSEVELQVIAVELYRIVDTPLLLSLPLFTFAGYILSESNSSQRLLNLTRSLFGWMPDGMAVVALLACAVFTALTGASGVTIVALGALLLPALRKSGYTEKFSTGLVTTSGSLGLLLPPSIPLILYGIIAQQTNEGPPFTVGELFFAGVLPGLLMIGLLAMYTLWANRKEPIPRIPFVAKDAKAAIRDAIWELPMPIFVLAGIFTGFLAVSELAAVTALYVLIVEMFIYKEIKIKQLPSVMSESMVMVGGILLILGVSLAFTNFLVDAQVPNQLFEWVKSHVDSKLTFLLLLNIFLLILGAILDIFAALVIMVPLILPVAVGYGIHPVHLGIIFLANMQIGYFTPPVGMNLFIASYRFNKPITELYHATLPFMAVLMISVLIITYVPELSLFFIDK